MDWQQTIIGVIGGLTVGGGLAYVVLRGRAQQDEVDLEKELARLTDEARDVAAQEMKTELSALTEQVEAEAADVRKEQKMRTDKLQQQESDLDNRTEQARRQEKSLSRRERDIGRREKKLADREGQISSLHDEHKERLESVAGISQSEARAVLMEEIEEDAKVNSLERVRAIEAEAKTLAEERARIIVSSAIQRYASEHVSDRTISAVTLPTEDMKGRIIGREGRNIRAFESASGCDVVIDESPDTVMISSFNPVRREIGKRAMERLLVDGRIHPARIEEIVERVRKEMDQIVRKTGEDAALELEITGLHPEVVKALGRLNYVTSFAQNVLRHSIEVGTLAGLMADEIGLKRKQAVRAGVLHDIGRALDQGYEGECSEIGAAFLRKHGESKAILHAVRAATKPNLQDTALSQIVAAAKTLSANRPGARRESLSSYINRLEDLERLALDFDGVERCYAIQAGQEVRVMVDNARMNDKASDILARDIAKRIEAEMSYTGEVKVSVIRSVRAVQYAR